MYPTAYRLLAHRRATAPHTRHREVELTSALIAHLPLFWPTAPEPTVTPHSFTPTSTQSCLSTLPALYSRSLAPRQPHQLPNSSWPLPAFLERHCPHCPVTRTLDAPGWAQHQLRSLYQGPLGCHSSLLQSASQQRAAGAVPYVLPSVTSPLPSLCSLPLGLPDTPAGHRSTFTNALGLRSDTSSRKPSAGEWPVGPTVWERCLLPPPASKFPESSVHIFSHPCLLQAPVSAE